MHGLGLSFATSWSWSSTIQIHGMCVARLKTHPKPSVVLNLSILQSLAFPMLSTSIFSSNGSIYKQSVVFDSHSQLNQTALDIVGLPALTGSNAWANLTANLAVSSRGFGKNRY